ncbi:DUF2270 domain-containing protein [Haloarculaceae archaeon H-GB11]|nr:DUF2270 domain-containing protein [Haloarculaceae archaeon H-GB1-1]MEA5388420.1 DUF2270 domain-containing protein [Haloarculaceae archaeon H-GB11]
MSGTETGPAGEPADSDLVEQLLEDSGNRTNVNGDFYRGEVDRATAWRARLDQTTNWAVVVVAAILTWAFSGGSNPHYVILIGMFAVVAFLITEANRYREYDVWRYRVRLLQKNVFAELYARTSAVDTDWQDELGELIRNPTFTVSFGHALAHRLRRVYLALLGVLFAAWVARITVFVPEQTWRQTAAIPGLAGEYVVAVVAGLYLLAGALALWTHREKQVREFSE